MFVRRIPRKDRRTLVRSLRSRLQVEELETRTLLSASSLAELLATPAVQVQPFVTNPTARGLTPAQIRHAYGFDQITFNNGGIAGDGTGQSIAIVDAYSDPNIASDLHVFDQTFGLADPQLARVVQMNGRFSPPVDSGWALETALDVEWAHAVAPGAKRRHVINTGDLICCIIGNGGRGVANRTRAGSGTLHRRMGQHEAASQNE